jgi:arylsulfatase A-like enzyme
MRVPLIAAWAQPEPDNAVQQRLQIPAGAIQEQVAAVHDLFPTLLEFLELESPADHAVDGEGMATLLSGQPDPGRGETFLMHYPHAPHRSDYFSVYRDGDWKVIYHYFPSEVSQGSHYQLYNLADDPFESTNLADSRPEKLAEMMGALVDSLESHGGLYPVATTGGTSALKPKLP